MKKAALSGGDFHLWPHWPEEMCIRDRAEGALNRLGHVEQAAERPPIRQTIEEFNAKIAAAREGQEKTAPTVKRNER